MKFFAFYFALFFLLIPSPVKILEYGVPAGLAADFINAGVKAGRTNYSEQVVEHLARQNSLTASENWEQDKTLFCQPSFFRCLPKF